jgi:hypothetical protein
MIINEADKLSLEELKREPHRIVEMSTTRKYSFDRDTLADFHLSALKKRFADLVDKIPVVRRFAEEQKLSEIRTIEDGALMLLPHTFYKSYSLSVLENSRFNVLTRWIGTLTSIDVSSVDAAGCGTIDDWIDALDVQTELRVRHSSGTTGKLSFIPTSTYELYTSLAGSLGYFQGFGDEPDAALNIAQIAGYPYIQLSHRHGAMASARMADTIIKVLFKGDESKLICLNPGRMSADMLSLGGRLQGAQAKGELGQLQLSPALMKRREEFAREQALLPQRMDEFFAKLAALKGQRVIFSGILPAIWDTVSQGLARGLENMFHPQSLMQLVGGAKGRVFPPDYQQQICRFTGLKYPQPGYGMTEAGSGLTRMCPQGHYHIPTNIIPYLLDPKSGAILPRTGTQKGRYGFLDIATQTRWGGFLTGDEITLNYNDATRCGCGRHAPFIVGDIRRYSEAEGGDDKITCAGAPAVHDRALEFITNSAG